MRSKIIKFFSVFLLVVTLYGSFAPSAQALFGIGDIVHDPINYIINGLKLAAQNVSLLSTGLPGSGSAAKSAVTAAEAGCVVSDKAQKIIDTADSAVGVSVIAGDAGNIAQLSAKIAVLNAIRLCYSTVLEALKVGTSLGSAAGGEQVINATGFSQIELNANVISLTQRIDRLVELREAAVKKMWEGVAYRILASVQQQITTKLVNSLAQKFKIGNFAKYADAVATQIYTANYVEKTYPEKADQLMIKSILSSDAVSYNLMPYLQNKARQNLGYDPKNLLVTDPNYYLKMATAGMAPTNPYALKMYYEEQAGATAAEAADMAKAEIAQGQGFIPARDCNGVITQQNQRLDTQRQALGKNLQVAQIAYNKLQAQQAINPSSVSAADLDKAAEDVNKAFSGMNDLGSKADFFAKACADIKNPAAAISNYTNSYLASAFNVVNAPKPGNLPFFANFVESVATNFLTNVISGGSPGAGTAQLLTDAGYKAANVAAADVLAGVTQAAALKNADNAANAANIVFSAAPNGVAGQYVVTWDASAIDNSTSVNISASGLDYSKAATSGQVTIRAIGGTILTLRVLDANKKLINSTTFTIPVSPTVNLTLPNDGTAGEAAALVKDANADLKNDGTIPQEPPGCNSQGLDAQGNPCSITAPVENPTGTVQGAYTSKIPLYTRGPDAEPLHPRD